MIPANIQLGLPSPEQLKGYRIWDSYFTPAYAHPGADGSSVLITDIERSLPAITLAWHRTGKSDRS